VPLQNGRSFSPLNFTDFPLVNKKRLTHGAYQLVVSEKPGKTWKNLEKPWKNLEKPEKPGKTWKNQEGDLNTTQKILRNLQAVHDVDQLLAKKSTLRLPGRDTRCGHGLK
jgi:hypothetical protein